jgi:catechol 2,3-dioxygenase-like lactoylglutathione lyase family enzyme
LSVEISSIGPGRYLWRQARRAPLKRSSEGPTNSSGRSSLQRWRYRQRIDFVPTQGYDPSRAVIQQMQLAKNVIDVGLSTNNLEPMLRFWQQDAGLRFDHVLPVRRGQKQYRHDAQGSVIKLNHHADPLPAAAPSGYREVIIAREGVERPHLMVDPDGNSVRLVPPGHDGVIQLAVGIRVRSLTEHRRFYGDILGFAEQSWSGGPAFRLGDSLLLLEEDRAATVDPVRQARGWRYITLQIADIDAVHDDLRSKGVREGFAPITLGDVARISMILDPDGNWIELSRRASIVGSLS